MTIVHVIPEVAREDAGPSQAVPRLCECLAAAGHDVELSCLAARRAPRGVRLDMHPRWPVLSRLDISSSHARALARKARSVDIVHNHSLWSMVNMATGWIVPGRRAKLVTSPRGTVSPVALRRSRIRKALVRPLQWRVLSRADLLHATSEEEFGQLRDAGLRAPTAVIPNGVDIPDLPVRTAPAGRRERQLLYLGRLHPIKALDRLLESWARLERKHPHWTLTVAGPGEPAHVAAVHRLAASLDLERVRFVGPQYGAEKTRAFAGAELFVLPSHSENFGMAVAEALAHGLPVIVSRGTPWQRVAQEACGWWVDNTVDALEAALDEALRHEPATLSAMGARGRAWMAREFAWPAIAQRMADSYEWILKGGTPPAWVKQ